MGISSLAVFTSDLRVAEFGDNHPAFTQKHFSGEQPLIGFFGTYDEDVSAITSLGFITFDTIKCPADQQFDASEETTTEDAGKENEEKDVSEDVGTFDIQDGGEETTEDAEIFDTQDGEEIADEGDSFDAQDADDIITTADGSEVTEDDDMPLQPDDDIEERESADVVEPETMEEDEAVNEDKQEVDSGPEQNPENQQGKEDEGASMSED